MVTDICAGNTDVYSLGPFYYAESTDGFIDGYILNEGRRYTLNRKLIQTRTNIVIWSETRKWFDPERWLLGPKQTSEITRPVPPRFYDELLNNYNLKE